MKSAALVPHEWSHFHGSLAAVTSAAPQRAQRQAAASAATLICKCINAYRARIPSFLPFYVWKDFLFSFLVSYFLHSGARQQCAHHDGGGTQLSAVWEVLNSKTLRGIVAVEVSLKYKYRRVNTIFWVGGAVQEKGQPLTNS